MQMRKTRLLLILGLILGLISGLVAVVPRQISYQGKLTDTGGNPVTGIHTLVLKFYKLETGGTPIWTESQGVTLNNGLYNVILGSVTPFPDSVNFSQQYWLGVTVDAGAELSPRYQLGASPYALNFPDTLRSNTEKVLRVKFFALGLDGFTVIVSDSGPGTALRGVTYSPISTDAGVQGHAGLGSPSFGVKATTLGGGAGLFAGHGLLFPVPGSSFPWAELATSAYAGYFSGNVHITGKLTSDDTLTYEIPFSDFVASNTIVNYSQGIVSLGTVSSVINYFYAPVVLPQNAQIIKVTVYWFDNDVSADINAQLIRYCYTTVPANTNITTLNSSGSSGAGSVEWVGTHTIDYSDSDAGRGCSYSVQATFPAGISTSCGIRAVKIKYLLR